MTDSRNQTYVRYEYKTMLFQRVMQIAAGYEDANNFCLSIPVCNTFVFFNYSMKKNFFIKLPVGILLVVALACGPSYESKDAYVATNSPCIDARFYENLANRQLQLECDSTLALLYYEKAFALCKSYDPQIWLNAAELAFNKKDTLLALQFLRQSALLGNTYWHPHGNLLIYLNQDSLELHTYAAISDAANAKFSKNYHFFDSILNVDQKIRKAEKGKSYYDDMYKVDTAINKVLISYIQENGFPKSSVVSYERLHHFFTIVIRHQMRGGDDITNKEDFELANKAMLQAIKVGELDPYTYALLYDERSWSLDSTTYYGVFKESMPDVKVKVEGIDERLQAIGLPPIYLYAAYWGQHEAGFDWYKESFLKQ
ncbi:MAG: transposase [Schleiferiaceae bacterium]|nr:transposase [Schleiferiaceae bacterium]